MSSGFGKIKKIKETVEDNLSAELAKELVSSEALKEMGTKVDTLKMVNTLGYGSSKGMVHDKAASAETGKREIAAVSDIVGYSFENISDEPVKYVTGLWSQDTSGNWTEKVVEKQAQPGEVFWLSRKYSALLLARIEFNGEISNAKLRTKKVGTEEPNVFGTGYYLEFKKIKGQKTVKVHDDFVKKAIAESTMVDGKEVWLIFEKYEPTFKFLDLYKSGTGKSVSKKKETTDQARKKAQDFAAMTQAWRLSVGEGFNQSE